MQRQISGLELSDFTGKPCNSRTAYEFVPKQDLELALEEVSKTLSKNGVLLELESPYILIVKVLGKDVSLFRSGKIIVKSTTDGLVARRVAQELAAKIIP